MLSTPFLHERPFLFLWLRASGWPEGRDFVGSVVELGACWMVIRTEQQNPIILVSQSAEHTKSRRSCPHKHACSSGGYESALFAVDWRQWCTLQIRFARSPRTEKITITHPPRPPSKTYTRTNVSQTSHSQAMNTDKQMSCRSWVNPHL